MTWMLKVFLAVVGVFAFPLGHIICRRIVTARWPHLGYALAFRVSTRVVSALQATAATLISLRTVVICQDIMKDSDPLIQSYVWFGWSYFVYDVIVMYLGHSYLEKEKGSSSSEIICLRKFLSRECLIVLHHFISFTIGFPVISFLRKGIGDFFVGCIIFAEFSTPFFSIRGIQKEMQWRQGALWTLNGLVFVITFFIGRVLTVPYMYWKFSQQMKVPLLNVPFQIPLKCNAGAGLFMLLQLYWFSLLIKGAINFLKEHFGAKHTSNSKVTDKMQMDGLSLMI